MRATLLLALAACAAATRELKACSGVDDDSATPACEEWCNDPGHCKYCKCRGCSMCQPCAPTASDDVDYTGCEEFCTDAESHCGLCKCRGCSICQGHHPEIACTPKDADDKNFETCQTSSRWRGS